MNQLDALFKFPIGSIVTHIGMPDAEEVTVEETDGQRIVHKRWKRPPQRLVVYERIAQECSGGIQLLYKVHAMCAGSGEYGIAFLKNLIPEELLKPYPTRGVT